ncbi:hypothetical protein HOLleu_04484 [Holothuria leucospilota]|uniref:C2H2-type domain-containing protein n=1 Tax=Holothuria leucospilota TaxID=206669 RepID=A0A9Q1HKU7_HOLLE|nr:hypothetical protein HOLleu_04484 [Holothuria leucospilota]
MEVNKQGAEDIPGGREGSDRDGLDQGVLDTSHIEVIEVMIVAATEECTTAVATISKNDENMEEMEQDMTAEEANRQPEKLSEEDQDMQEPVNQSENIPEQASEETYPGPEEQQTLSDDVDQDTAVSKENVCVDPRPVELNQEESVNRVTDSGEGTQNSDGLYNCRFCEKTFKGKSDWTNHEQEHSSNNPHVHNLHEHHELTQTIEIVWGCQSCGVVCATEESLLEHLKSHNDEIVTVAQTSEQNTSDKGENLETGGKKYFRCRFCFKCFGSKEEKWRRHELLHSSETSLKCYICKEVFCRKHQYEAHMKRHATSNKSTELECKFCNTYFPSEGSFEEHIKAHVEELVTEQKNRKTKKRPKAKRKTKKRVEKKDFKCRFCQKSFRERQDRCEKHELTHFTIFKCYFCEEMFSSRVRCNLHEMEHETKCRHCQEMFTSVHDLRIHESTHAKKKLHQCRFCDKLFYKTSNRRRHELTHTGEKPHKCSFCDKAFRLLHHKKKHERLHKEATEVKADSDVESQSYGIPTVLPPCEKVTTEEPPIQEAVETKYFRCRFCLKCFGSKEEKCRRHEMLHLSDTSLKCQFCEEVFCRKHQFEAHVQKHVTARENMDNSVFECQLCNTFFVTDHSLQEHLNSHADEVVTKQKNRKGGKASQDKAQETSEKKEFTCRFCLKPFGRRQDRCEKHELTHFWKTTFRCYFCEKLFDSKVKRNVHEMEHEAKCHFCDEVFPSVSKLRIHEATHKKTKLYRCGYCEKMFHKTSNRRRHEMTHTGEKPYKCSHCEKAFRLVHHLKKHERLHKQNTQG